MNFKLTIIILLLASQVIRCSSKNKTDNELLEKDKLELGKNLDPHQLSAYRFGKILIRASVEKDTVSTDFQYFKSDLDRIFNNVIKYDTVNAKRLSLPAYISIYRDYKKMENFIMKTDEDIFPTLSDAFNVTYGDSVSRRKEYYSGKEKDYVQNIEHAVLSAMVLLSNDLGKEVSLYECSKTKPALLPDTEIKTLLQFYRGFLFFEKKLYYLSEDEISANINWLNNHRDIDLPYTRAIFKWGNLNNENTHIGFHALNHLFRGFDRLMMEREIDEKRAFEDFEMFLRDANKIGLDNEIVWAIDACFYIKKEDSEKTITALKKLNNSNLISADDKKRIDETIDYSKNRKFGKVLNGFYDKFLLGKIATTYMFSVLAKVDWEKILKEQNMPHAGEMFKTIERLKDFNNNLMKYTTAGSLKEPANDIKNKGENLWNKTKELVR